MLRVMMRGGGVQPTVLGSGETLLVGRAPSAELANADANPAKEVSEQHLDCITPLMPKLLFDKRADLVKVHAAAEGLR